MKFNLLKQLMFLSIMLSASVIFSQTVTGTVSGDDGPLPGVSVLEKGTTNGATTDFDGKYSINLTKSNAVLAFSYVGFISQEVAVNGQSVVNLVLKINAQALEEVVIVGYGSQTKKEVTSSIVQLDEKSFNKGVVNSTAQLLQGKVAGLTISNRGGDPNSNGAIRLRGLSTIGANTEPLVVIDGLIGGSLNNVDPNDIKTINVLKDGSAAAIYGSRGSSGVILVTTKKGSSTRSEFEYSSQVETASVANTVSVMNAAQFVAVGGFDLGSTTDWMKEVTRTGATFVNNFAISGGSDQTNYRISANTRNVEGILKNSGFDQLNTRANINTKILNDKVDVTFNTSYTKKNSQFGFNEALRYAVLYNPTAPILGVNSPFIFNGEQYGGYFEALGLFDSFNPASIVNQNRNDGKSAEFNYGLNLKYELSKDFSVNFSVSEETSKRDNVEYYPITSHFRGMASSATRKGLAKFYHSDYKVEQIEGFGTYKKDYDKSRLTVVGGYSFQQTNFFDHFFQLGNFPDNVLDYSNLIENSYDLRSKGYIAANSSASPDNKIIAFFGRANYTFDEAIYVMASVRREGSTKLGVDNKWGTFPAFGIGVDLNKYFALKNVELLKVRLGYGETGSLPGQDGLSKEIRNIIYDTNTGAASSTLARAANPNLKWEQKAETNLGLEFNTSRFKSTLDIYSRDVSDFIIERTVDVATYGVNKRFENAGKLNTKGIEVSLNYDLVKKDNFTYNTGIVLSHYKSILKDYVVDAEMRGNLGSPGQNSTNMIRVKKGSEIGQIWGPVFSGEVDVDGKQIFVDVNGDGTLVTNQDQALADNVDFKVLGKGTPDLEIGWTNQLTFKNWDVNAFFRGAFGHSLVNTYRAFFEPHVGSQTGYNYVNTSLANPDITSAQFSSLYVEKANFFKLDNLSVGYNFTLSEATQKYVKSLKFSLTASNVFTITNYTGNDPDPALQDRGSADNGGYANGNDVLAPGIDRRNNYFTARRLSLGIVMKL